MKKVSLGISLIVGSMGGCGRNNPNFCGARINM